MQSLSGTRIAVLGAGLIGVSWAALFTHYGADVCVYDPEDAARAALEARSEAPYAHLAELAPDPAPRGRLRVTDDLSHALDGAMLIQENAPENIPQKHALFAQVEALAPPDAIVASSTSALTWSELAPGFKNPRRLITAHPFNPPHLVPLVELYGPDPARLDRAETFYRAAGRVPVRLNTDATGHIANRLASALWREAVHIVAEGIADVDAVDAALVNGPGLRWSVMGAHMAYHLGGGAGGMAGYLTHLGPSQQRRWASLGTPTLTPEVCQALIDGITQEAAAAIFPLWRPPATPPSSPP
ncbi:3-hydroxyacyl-CoA dehydrogenase NAD-binding domain-containing protein [Pararhodobacter sp.]|uniref:3-hydroxyacyl-CoA dehydrogenase NAD-binding domain-containing protein n=1 Tax=Pararhodobacter sp. TaxID=2127056 RepID=UPI002AFDE1A4|nr:3-hydroxyacyl-CoA dehydrogenase NAD-binding domain-containing protein [Pararhodobacter sp.]